MTNMCVPRKRVGTSIVAALCAICLLDATVAAAAAAHGGAEQPPAEHAAGAQQQPVHVRNDDTANMELLKQVLTKKCLHRYTMTCLKLDLVRLIDRLGTARAYQLVPGVSLIRAAAAAADGNHNHQQQQQQNRGNSIPVDVVRSLVRGNESAEELDGYLMEKVDAYLNSLSISVKLVDSAVVENVRKLSSQMLVNILPNGLLETGRGKKNGMHAALWSAGTLAAIAFAALAAMSGKALMTAMLALVLAAVCALKGHGGGGGGGGGGYGKTSHYEIITKPAIYDHDHLVHGASYSSAPYSYARHLTMDEGGGAGGGGAYHLQGHVRVGQPPQRVTVVHAAPATAVHPASSTSSDDSPSGPGHPASSAAGDEDADDEATVGHLSYPLSPIAYIPTNNT